MTGFLKQDATIYSQLDGGIDAKGNYFKTPQLFPQLDEWYFQTKVYLTVQPFVTTIIIVYVGKPVIVSCIELNAAQIKLYTNASRKICFLESHNTALEYILAGIGIHTELWPGLQRKEVVELVCCQQGNADGSNNGRII